MFAVKLLSFFLAFCVLLICLDIRLRPAIREFAVLEAHSVASSVINKAVEALLIEKAPDYSELISLKYTESGALAAITGNIVSLNLFKSQITNAIDSAFDSSGKTFVKVPLGSAMGVTVLSGFGPVIDVAVSFSSSTEADFENEFTAVGMNQTQHRIMLTVTSNILMALAGGRVANSVTTTFCVAQTVIVGTVPDIVFN